MDLSLSGHFHIGYLLCSFDHRNLCLMLSCRVTNMRSMNPTFFSRQAGPKVVASFRSLCILLGNQLSLLSTTPPAQSNATVGSRQSCSQGPCLPCALASSSHRMSVCLRSRCFVGRSSRCRFTSSLLRILSQLFSTLTLLAPGTRLDQHSDDSLLGHLCWFFVFYRASTRSTWTPDNQSRFSIRR